LELQYPVDSLRVKVSETLEEHSAASNAVSAPARRHIVGRYARLKPQQMFLAVHRVDFTVYYRRLEADEFRLLRAIEPGQAIGAALEMEADLDPQQVQAWFGNWAQLGWLYAKDTKAL
jgi:hypothetical protein